MLYCINATAEPSSGGGETTDILPVLMSGIIKLMEQLLQVQGLLV